MATVEEMRRRIEWVEAALADLRDFIDKNDGLLEAKLDNLNKAMMELQIVVYGSEQYRLRGVGERLDLSEQRITAVEKTLQSAQDTLKGVKIGLALNGAGLVGAIVAVINGFLN